MRAHSATAFDFVDLIARADLRSSSEIASALFQAARRVRSASAAASFAVIEFLRSILEYAEN
jgi:hypothetical protein